MIGESEFLINLGRNLASIIRIDYIHLKTGKIIHIKKILTGFQIGIDKNIIVFCYTGMINAGQSELSNFGAARKRTLLFNIEEINLISNICLKVIGQFSTH